MKRKLVAMCMGMVLSLTLLTGCGGSEEASTNAETKAIVDEMIADAKALEAQGDIESALKITLSAIEQYPEYNDYLYGKQKYYENLKEEMKEQESVEEIREKLDAFLEEKDFVSIYTYPESIKDEYWDLGEKFDELKQEYVECIKSEFDAMIVEAESYILKGEFDTGFEIIQELNTILLDIAECDKELFQQYYHGIVSERNNIYSTCKFHLMPKNLISKDSAFDTFFTYYRDYVTFEDRFGHKFTEYYEFVLEEDEDEAAYIIFNANGKYERFSAKFAMDNYTDNSRVAKVEVYGDDTLLHTVDSFTSYSEPAQIEVDITNYKLIKIKVTRTDGLLDWREPTIALYDASFYNVTPMEFEPYTPGTYVGETEE